MRPRLVFRTHYQVEEPIYVGLLVRACTSPDQSAYADTVAPKVADQVTALYGRDFNVPAGRYLIDLARALDVVTDNLTWTPKGHFLNLFAVVSPRGDDPFSLSTTERLAYFKLFLEADGAAWIGFLKRIAAAGYLSHAAAMKTAIVEEVFSEILSAYLTMTNNTADRVTLRKELQKLQRGYQGKARQHKLHLHLQTLYRLGLIDRVNGTEGIQYREMTVEQDRADSPVRRFLREVPDYVTLERRAGQQQWFDVALSVLFPTRTYGDLADRDARAFAVAVMAELYQKVVGRGVMFAPIEVLLNAVQIESLARRGLAFGYADLLRTLENEQRENPKGIRFHVDRRGRPAFVKMSGDWLGAHLSVA